MCSFLTNCCSEEIGLAPEAYVGQESIGIVGYVSDVNSDDDSELHPSVYTNWNQNEFSLVRKLN
ncbi:hypothetical protein ACLM5H_07385 [Fredinandcohnia humi]